MLTARKRTRKGFSRRLRVLGAVVGLAVAGGASASRYTVRRGDTLALIASRNHVSLSPVALAAANGIVGTTLYSGARLRVDVSPAGAPPAPAAPFIAIPTTTVGSATTMTKQAKRLGVSAAALASLNKRGKTDALAPGT